MKEVRRTGKSTVLALRAIASAVESPGTRVLIKDHHPHPQADQHLAHLISDIVRELKLSIVIIRSGSNFYLKSGYYGVYHNTETGEISERGPND